MIYKESVKIKPLISFSLCLIMFFLLLNKSESIVFLFFSVFFLFTAIIKKSITINTYSMIIFLGFKKSVIEYRDIENIELTKEKIKMRNLFYLGILYLLLDFTINTLIIYTKDKIYKIPMKYFNNEEIFEEINKRILCNSSKNSSEVSKH